MDDLYDIEHRIWWTSGAPGWVELALNVAELLAGTWILAWTWRHRADLCSAPGSTAAQSEI